MRSEELGRYAANLAQSAQDSPCLVPATLGWELRKVDRQLLDFVAVRGSAPEGPRLLARGANPWKERNVHTRVQP